MATRAGRRLRAGPMKEDGAVRLTGSFRVPTSSFRRPAGFRRPAAGADLPVNLLVSGHVSGVPDPSRHFLAKRRTPTPGGDQCV